ncbi:MAG TPA: ABC transporter substrate-binding protein [Mycobacteriales bacterium]|nr:ABC transporter substrate-binding protein [Mycobacteriales bacterium]
MNRRSPRGVVAVVSIAMLVGLVSSACGARLSGAERRAAAAAVLGSAVAGGTAATPATAGGGAGEALPSGGGNRGVTGAGPGGVAATAPAGSAHTGHQATTGPAAQSAASPGSGSATCSRSAAGPGVSSSTVRVGTVASLSGPVPGLFTGAVQGEEAFANYVNHSGGLCGRTMAVDAADDGTNCSQDENATDDLANKDFALVGTFALYDGCGATILKQHPTVSDIHVALDPAAAPLPNHFDVQSGVRGYATGMFAYFAHKYGSKVQHVGTIVENIPSAVANQQNMEHAAESVGWRFTYSRNASPVETTFMNDFVKMCHQGVQIFFELTETAQNAATMMQNERAAGCHGLINIIPIAYDQAFIPDYQGSPADLNGIVGWNEYSLFFNPDEAQRIPELKTLQTWFNRTYPHQPLNLYAMYAWADGMLFRQAYQSVHGQVTRASLMAALRRIKNFNAGGVISPANPASKSVGKHCYILWRLENGTFSRMDDPASGYRCDGRFLPYHG